MPHATTHALRDALIAARRGHRALAPEPHWALALPDAEAACALQLATGEALGEWTPGELPRHWKSGAGARELPLLHAPLLPSGVVASPADLRERHFFSPGLEAEIALRLGRDVTAAEAAALRPGDADGLVDAMAVSLEVVDSRWADLAHTPALLKLADFQVHGALVLGAWTAWRGVDWAAQRGTLQVGEAAPIAFAGSHPLGTPLWLLPAWLRHLARDGQTIPAGTVVSTGAWCGCVPAATGARVLARFDGLGEAVLQL